MQYQVVHRSDALLVRIVVGDAAPRTIAQDVEASVEQALARAGAALPVAVEVVDAIARDPGHAAKTKLVVSEAPPDGIGSPPWRSRST